MSLSSLKKLLQHFKTQLKLGIFQRSISKIEKSLGFLANLATQQARFPAASENLVLGEKIAEHYLHFVGCVSKLDPNTCTWSALKTTQGLSQVLAALGREGQRLINTPSGPPAKDLDAFFVKLKRFKAQLACYFCSRPFYHNGLTAWSVNTDKNPVKVPVCALCKVSLNSGKNVKVLYFKLAGIQVHWTEYESYDPSRDFGTVIRGSSDGLSGVMRVLQNSDSGSQNSLT